MFIENRINEFEKDICSVLAHVAFHIHPKIIEKIQKRNSEEFNYFEELFDNRINVGHYLFDGSARVFPGVKRYVSGQGNKQAANSTLNIRQLLIIIRSLVISGVSLKTEKHIMAPTGEIQA